MISPINPQKDIRMKLLNLNVTLLLFGVAIILNSFTTMVLLQRAFGDSTTPKQNNTMPLSIQPSKVIR